MTKENYTQLTNQELVNSIQSIHNFGKRGFPKFLRCSFPELFQELITRTSFMDKTYMEHNHVVPFMDRIFCVENNLNSLPTCQNPDCQLRTMLKTSWLARLAKPTQLLGR